MLRFHLFKKYFVIVTHNEDNSIRKASYLPFMSCFPVHHINPFLLQRKMYILPITSGSTIYKSNIQVQAKFMVNSAIFNTLKLLFWPL